MKNPQNTEESKKEVGKKRKEESKRKRKIVKPSVTPQLLASPNQVPKLSPPKKPQKNARLIFNSFTKNTKSHHKNEKNMKNFDNLQNLQNLKNFKKHRKSQKSFVIGQFSSRDQAPQEIQKSSNNQIQRKIKRIEKFEKLEKLEDPLQSYRSRANSNSQGSRNSSRSSKSQNSKIINNKNQITYNRNLAVKRVSQGDIYKKNPNRGEPGFLSARRHPNGGRRGELELQSYADKIQAFGKIKNRSREPLEGRNLHQRHLSHNSLRNRNLIVNVQVMGKGCCEV